MSKIIIILCGGLGKRMESDVPKVINNFNNKPMLIILLEEILLNSEQMENIYIVVGKYKSLIKETLEKYNILHPKILFMNQTEALGTGHAVMCCRGELLTYKKDSNILVLYGDTPLISQNTIRNMFNVNNVKLLTTIVKNPTGFGRIIENDNKIDKIVEHKDCCLEQLEIRKINCGIYSFNNSLLCKYLPLINNSNSQNEYYLTDIIELIKENEGINIEEYIMPKEKQYEVLGVNTKDQLNKLEEVYKNRDNV